MKTGFSRDWIAELKAGNDIVSVISKYVTVQKKGKTNWACCPFHFEKTPSFAINEYEQYFHCFGCGASGDVIKFIEKIESIDFYDACKILADNSGMKLPEFGGNNESLIAAKKKKDTYLKMLKDTANYYHLNLVQLSPPSAVKYIKGRGMDSTILKTFGIGYSLGWTEVIDHLSKLGYSKDEMVESGICERKNNSMYDSQSKRLVFPIVNSYGDVLGFSARLLEDADFAKYKNTTQTMVFDKSKCVYNINGIKKLKQENNLQEVIMVEGQMDVIALYQNGFKNAVACMGTALTHFHAREIKRFCDKVVVCFDGDSAGKKATLRSLDILVNASLNVYVVSLADGLDPDDYLAKFGKESFKNQIDNAKYWVEYLIMSNLDKYDISKPEEKSDFIKECLFVIQKLTSKSEQDVYLNILKDITNISISILRSDLESLGQETTINVVEKEKKVLPSSDNAGLKAVKFIMAALLHKKPYATLNEKIQKNLINPDYVKVYDYIKSEQENGRKPIIGTIFQMFDVDDNKEISDIINYEFTPKEDASEYYNDCISYLQKVGLERLLQKVSKEMTTESDLDKRRELSKQVQKIILELKGI